MKQTIAALIVTATICLGIGFLAGFFTGVYTTELGKTFLEGMVAVEQPAEVSEPKKLVQDRYLFDYPSNWTLDEDAEFFDLDSYFSIDTPGGSYIEFDIMPAEVSTQDQVNDSVEYFERLFAVEKKIEFKRWGDYEGTG
ncbi:MAG: hypothetical protein AAGA30_10110, partial [Planctomycetota bacterium]